MSELTICTLTSAGYEPYSRVLMDSLREHQPDSRLIVCTLDEPDPRLPTSVEQLTPEQMGVEQPDLHRVAAASSLALVADRLKSPILIHLLEREAGPILLIDADSCAYAELDPIAEILTRERVLLTPHARRIAPGAPLNQAEIAQLRCGVINGGLIGVSPGAEPFLNWLWDRGRVATVPDDAERLLHAQRWLDLSIGYFGPLILRDPAFNLTIFELMDRDIEWDDDRPQIGGGPLRHFHFLTDVDPRRRDTFTSNPIIAESWPTPAERPGAARLFDEYRDRILAAGYEQAQDATSRLEAFADGEVIPQEQKSLYARALYSHEQTGTPEPPNPFRDGREAFEDWARLMSGP